MKLNDFALLTDENIDAQIVTSLRLAGFRVRDVKEDGLVGSEDSVLLRLALAKDRIVLTHDSDFGTLAIAQEEPFVGIVYLRPGHIKPEFTLGTIQTLLDQNPDLEPPFIVVAVRTSETVRLRIRQIEKG